MLQRLIELLYPAKCVFCTRLLGKEETDICTSCRKALPWCEGKVRRIPRSAATVAVFWYEDDVREAILRYKFRGQAQYSHAFGRLLAMKIAAADPEFDLICHVPVSRARKAKRGYDQSERLAKAVGEELGMKPRKLLRKIRNNPAQSGLPSPEQRRANVLGVYRCADPEAVRDQKILLIDDVTTTGATLSECCKTLLDAGAARVVCAALAQVRRNEVRT